MLERNEFVVELDDCRTITLNGDGGVVSKQDRPPCGWFEGYKGRAVGNHVGGCTTIHNDGRHITGVK